jgi:hypothetical protein
MTWRVARCLDTLLSQVNAAAPLRSKISDGSIGDAKHATRSSDHNPWVRDRGVGVVTARDFTHDPRHFNAHSFAEALKASGDRRIKYVISNGRIWNPAISPNWRPYRGVNAHTQHTHVSVKETKLHYDDTTPWKVLDRRNQHDDV